MIAGELELEHFMGVHELSRVLVGQFDLPHASGFLVRIPE